MNSKITGIILAGGKSDRFGSNKAFASWKGQGLLIEKVLNNLKQVFSYNLIIVKKTDEYFYMNEDCTGIVEDIFCDFHSLGGIYSGLKNIPTDYAFICGCDMPFIKTEIINMLLQNYRDYYAVIPYYQNTAHPLCGIYSKKCISAIKGMIDKNRFKINDLFNIVDTHFLKEEEIKTYDPEGLSFFDIDTMEDYLLAGNIMARHNNHGY